VSKRAAESQKREPAARVRLFLEAPFEAGALVLLPPRALHHLGTVLRLAAGASLLVFNGRDGEWRARIERLSRKGGTVRLERQVRPQLEGADLRLLFAPVKRSRLDLVAEKATELGVAALGPVLTARTNAERVNLERLRHHVVGAAEQCGRLTVPGVLEPVRLEDLVSRWDAERRLLFCDEAGGAPIGEALRREAAGIDAARPPRWAVLIGPEGGFASEERAALRRLPQCLPVSLGPRLLRAETAAIAALSLWQALLGDWHR